MKIRTKLLVITSLLLCFVCCTSSLSIADQPRSRSAVELFREAHDGRHVWKNFPGFYADILVESDGSSNSGTIDVDDQCNFTLNIAEDAKQKWLTAKLQSVISHRRPSDEATEDVSFVNSEPTQHVSGVAIAKNDGSGVYRLLNGRIREVHRKSEKSWFEITNVAYFNDENGRYLPAITTVTYRDPQSGDIESVRTNQFDWKQIGAFVLPTESLTVETGKNGQRITQRIVFSNLKLKPEQQDSSEVSTSSLLKPLPESLTSFGAATLKGYLYVFSGHNGDAHGFGKDLLNNHFRRIKLDDANADWEELVMHAPAQSVALLSDDQYIYRISGLSFNNTGEEKTSFNSTTYFGRYSPTDDTWTELSALPEGRSSMDAAIIGQSVYVVGGWNLQGEQSSSAKWHDKMLRFDLENPSASWVEMDGPGYDIRALAVAAHGKRLYAIGGMTNKGISRKVSVFDTESGTWTVGPELKADHSTAGFAASSFATGGSLYVAGASGVVYRLEEDGSDWSAVDRMLFPRMFLRLLPIDNDRLVAVGGTSGSSRSPVVESILVNSTKRTQSKSVSWSVPFKGRAKHSQSIVLEGSKLYTFGGNASRAPHDFSEAAFVNEAFEFDLGQQKAKQLADLPRPVQSAVAVSNSQTSEHRSIIVAGGLGFGEGKFGSRSEVFEFSPKSNTWSTLGSTLPEPRGMFDAVRYDDAIWMFAGSGKGLNKSILHWWGDDSPIMRIPNTEIPTARRSFGGAVIGKEYFAIGGLGDGNKIVESVDVFDMEARTWRKVASPKTSRVFPSVCTDGKKIYLFGGFGNGDGHFNEANSLEAYDPTTDRWSTIVENAPGLDASMRIFSMQGRILFFGVAHEVDGLANFVLFDPNPTEVPESVTGLALGGGRSRDDSERNAKLLMRRDIDKDGRLSAHEMGSRMASFFADADEDKDSFLVFSEVKSAMLRQEENATSSK